MFKFFYVAVISAALSGCMSNMPNTIKQVESEFDGVVEYTMKPGFVYGKDTSLLDITQFALGLFWKTSMDDNVIIVAEIQNEMVNIQSAAGLQFNIDENIVQLDSLQLLTEFDSKFVNGMTFTTSRKNFQATAALIERILQAQSVKVRLVTGSGNREGELLTEKTSSAVYGFRDFMAKIKAL